LDGRFPLSKTHRLFLFDFGIGGDIGACVATSLFSCESWWLTTLRAYSSISAAFPAVGCERIIWWLSSTYSNPIPSSQETTNGKELPPRRWHPQKKVNKTQLSGNAMKDNPKVGPSEIARIVSKQGLKVTPGLVSNVKTTAKKKRRRRRKAAPVAKPAVSDRVSLSTLVQTKKMAEQLGGVEKAKDALAALAKLQ